MNTASVKGKHMGGKCLVKPRHTVGIGKYDSASGLALSGGILNHFFIFGGFRECFKKYYQVHGLSS